MQRGCRPPQFAILDSLAWVRKAGRDRRVLVDRVEELVERILIADVNLNLEDLAVPIDMVVGAVVSIELQTVGEIGVAAMDLGGDIVAPGGDLFQVDDDAGLVELVEEGKDLIGAALGAGERVAAGQVPHEIRLKDLLLDRSEGGPVKA